MFVISKVDVRYVFQLGAVCSKSIHAGTTVNDGIISNQTRNTCNTPATLRGTVLASVDMLATGVCHEAKKMLTTGARLYCDGGTGISSVCGRVHAAS